MRYLILAVALGGFVGPAVAQPARPNVLMIIVDDLRCELGCYGAPLAKTPNIDRLAASGVRFDRAYCQFPLCNPSRSSMLTGRHPGDTGVLGNRDWFRAERPGLVALPQHFKAHGYATLRSGKIFHGGIDDVVSWTRGGEPRRFGHGAPAATGQRAARRAPRREGDGRQLTKAERSDRWLVLEGDGSRHGDSRAADRVIGYLQEYAEGEQPFFVALGLSKPHSPLEAPQWCYDLYPLESIEPPVDFAPRPTVPEGFPRGSIRRRNADLFIGRDATPSAAREMIRAYLASTSFVDWNVGRVTQAMDRLGLWEHTIVVLWGDHGYQLGEKGKWSKAGSLWEQGARTPLIIRAPGASGDQQACDRIVQAIDIYPTLTELCKLPTPETVQGRALTPLLEDPGAAWDHPAFTVWSEDGESLTGIVVRTPRWRYAEFTEGGAMLVDYENDPHELTNLAGDPRYAEVERRLARLVAEYRREHGPGAAGD